MKNAVRSTAASFVLAAIVLLGACGGEPSKAEFVDHAVEISTVATTEESKASVRETFSCVYDKIGDDTALVSKFMDLGVGEDIPDDLSADISQQMQECIVASDETEAEPVPTSESGTDEQPDS